MQVVLKPENGSDFVEYEVTGNKITFGDDELTINLAKRERDDDVMIDICKDYLGNLTVGTGGARVYVAQVFVPARQYRDIEIGEEIHSEPVPFDIDNVILTLYEQED